MFASDRHPPLLALRQVVAVRPFRLERRGRKMLGDHVLVTETRTHPEAAARGAHQHPHTRITGVDGALPSSTDTLKDHAKIGHLQLAIANTVSLDLTSYTVRNTKDVARTVPDRNRPGVTQ